MPTLLKICQNLRLDVGWVEARNPTLARVLLAFTIFIPNLPF